MKPTEVRNETYGENNSTLKFKATCYLNLEKRTKITTDAFCIVDTQAENLLKSKFAIDLTLRSLYNEGFIIFISP